MYVLEPRPGDKERYYGCLDCINKRQQQLDHRDSLTTNASRVFFAAGTAISGGCSLTIETNIFTVCATAIVGGSVFGASSAWLVSWCFNKCFLRDRHCQHLVPVKTIDNEPSPQAATAPEIIAQNASPQAATAPQAPPADTRVETAPPVSTQTETAPPVRNDGSEVRFITSPREFRQRFANAIR